jgi:hypothetical protein
MLNSGSDSEYPCVVPDLTRKDAIFSTEYDVSCGFIIYDLHFVEVHSF